MARRRSQIPPASPEAAPAPRHVHVIDPHAVYLPEDVRILLHLLTSSQRREIRENRLTMAKRCGRYYFLGQHLLDRIQAGVIRRSPASTTP